MSENYPAEYSALMPAVFIGHGNPMNAIEDNPFSQAWRQIGSSLPRPQYILCISAHWETHGTQVTAMERPRTIHDFYGFPRELYELRYPAPGSPALTNLVAETVNDNKITLDSNWGLDHGAWSVLSRMFPQADIPVVQLSLDYNLAPDEHFALAQKLKPLRKFGVLLVGSGNIVHNLRLMNWEGEAYDWALEFDELVEQRILNSDHQALIHYEQFGEVARLAIPTNEHYLPLLYILAVQEREETVEFFSNKIALASVSMRSMRVG